MNGFCKPSIYESSTEAIIQWLSDHGHPSFRINQIYQWLFQRTVSSFDEMTNLSKELRDQLQECFSIPMLTVLDQLHASEDDTRKLLFQVSDGEGIETVCMPHYSDKVTTDPKTGKVSGKKAESYTLCLSTQAGCLFACRFCASGQRGLTRNLSASEIIAQVTYFLRNGYHVTNIVFMGTGEPLHNIDAMRKSIEILCDPGGLDFSNRKITISTVGLVPEIYRIAKEDWKTKLAVSLHATTDEKRAELMPLAKVYQLDQLIDALRFYQIRNKRRISFEYLMMDGINDSNKDADRLVKLCNGLLSHINLIPFNPVTKTPYKPSPPERIERFKKILVRQGIDSTVRYSRGRNIEAACGQLRLRHN